MTGPGPRYQGPLYGFDLETTGIDPEQDRIVTASIVCYGRSGRPSIRLWTADPGVEIPAAATAVHGITTETARAAGRPAGDVVSEILTELMWVADRGCPLVVMNAAYDLTLLDREARRHGIGTLRDRCLPPVVDPRILDMEVDPWRAGRRTLTDLCRHYRVPLDDAHRADSDAMAACVLTQTLVEQHPELGALSLQELHSAQVQWARVQGEDLRRYYARTPGKELRAAGVRLEWPFIPAPRESEPS